MFASFFIVTSFLVIIHGFYHNETVKNFPVDSSYLTLTNLVPNFLTFFRQSYQEVPSDLDPYEIKFWLYTRINSHKPDIVNLLEYDELRRSNFDYGKPVIFYTHGRQSAPIFPLLPKIHIDILREKDANVFLVDWTKVAFQLENQMLANAPIVGTHIGYFINWLMDKGPLQLNTLHLIGFSFGSHLSGIAARTISSGRPGRITALDPSSTDSYGSFEGVRKGDADYLEVIHTDGFTFTQKDPIGDADFYPNWGRNMPGCLTEICNHIRAFEYFQASIGYENAFKATKCRDYDEILNRECSNLGTANMGGLGFKNISGVYYIKTTGSPPYYVYSLKIK